MLCNVVCAVSPLPPPLPGTVPQDARDFGVDGYTLRLQRMDRKIKLFICVTLYNEDYDELRKTLVGICDVSCGQSWWRGRRQALLRGKQAPAACNPLRPLTLLPADRHAAALRTNPAWPAVAAEPGGDVRPVCGQGRAARHGLD